MKQTAIIVQAIVIVLLTVFCLNLNRLQKKTVTDSNNRQSQGNAYLMHSFETFIKNNDIHLADNMLLYNSRNDSVISVDDLVQGVDKPLLVIRFSELHCEDCVRYMLLKIIRFSSEQDMRDNVVILAQYQDKRSLNIVLDRLQIKFKTYLVNKMPLPCEEETVPCVFLLDGDKTVKHVFIPDKNNPRVSDYYLHLIKERYFTQQKQN